MYRFAMDDERTHGNDELLSIGFNTDTADRVFDGDLETLASFIKEEYPRVKEIEVYFAGEFTVDELEAAFAGYDLWIGG